MEFDIDVRRSIPENAAGYYERAKKARRKLVGLEKAIADTERKLSEAADIEVSEAAYEPIVSRKKQWYEKFRWFFSSDGYLVVGGRDATSNEVLVKKHVNDGDLVFHASVHGAPFFIIKNERGGDVPESTLLEAARAAASYSSAWRNGQASCDVYQVEPHQVSKTPPAGEYLPKGAFMVYGTKNWYRNTPLGLAVGVSEDGQVIGGPETAVDAHCGSSVRIGPGHVKSGALAKQVAVRLGTRAVDIVQYFIPGGKGAVRD